jgi:hypothetical protein
MPSIPSLERGFDFVDERLISHDYDVPPYANVGANWDTPKLMQTTAPRTAKAHHD